ncbi:MAG: hypothetical protein IJN42_02310 [Clostridia bacterium]|nr:hypothetical protein [Clostridia bacterium]
MRKFILGTDWWTDCDDAVAMRLLARAHKNGEIQLLGIGINACMDCSVASLDGFLNAEGASDIPLGIDLDATDFGGKPSYQQRLSALCKRYKTNADAENAVHLYRRLLAESDDKIEIVEIGFLQVIADVLRSRGDDLSPLDGVALVKEKVSKIWVMAGKWDEVGGKENNFARNERARMAATYFCDQCPVPVTFLGWEVSNTVITGGNLETDDILYQVLCDHGSFQGRSSWDPMLVLLAIIGDESLAGYDVVCGRARVESNEGKNYFEVSENGLHKYVVKTKEDLFYRDMIHERIASV